MHNSTDANFFIYKAAPTNKLHRILHIKYKLKTKQVQLTNLGLLHKTPKYISNKKINQEGLTN